MVKIQVNSSGKAYLTSGNKVLLAQEGSGDTIEAINSSGSAISSGDKVFIAPLATPQSGANYEIIPVKTSDSLGLGFFTVSNVTVNLTDKYAYNFNSSNFLQIPKVFDYTQPWEFNICLQTGSYVGGEQYIYFGGTNTYGEGGLQIYLYDNKFYFDCHNTDGRVFDINNYPVTINTTYYVRVGWTGTQYYVRYSTNGTDWTSETPVTSSVQLYQKCPNMRIGSRLNNSSYFQGKIFLDKTYFISNGKVVWQAMYDGTWTNIDNNVLTGIANESIASGSVGDIQTVLGE